MGKQHSELAYKAAIHRTIPSGRDVLPVTAESGTVSLAKYSGMYIWVRALTLDVTILRQSQTVVAGEGFVLEADAAHQEFFVDPGDDLTLSHRSSGDASLEILYDE